MNFRRFFPIMIIRFFGRDDCGFFSFILNDLSVYRINEFYIAYRQRLLLATLPHEFNMHIKWRFFLGEYNKRD